MTSEKTNLPVGLIPAAGHASRIQPLPCSKELMPVGFQPMGANPERQELRPKAVSHYLLEAMHCAGARKAFLVLSPGKWDIPAYYKSGALAGMDLAYVVTEYPYGAPFSLKQACPFVSRETILFGFPDIYASPKDAYRRLLEHKAETEADLVLGLFPAEDASKMDMVGFNDQGRIDRIDIKPRSTDLTYTWIFAVWGPGFTRFLQTYLEEVEPDLRRQWLSSSPDRIKEYYVGHVIQAALTTDLTIEHVTFDQGCYRDIGTPEDLVDAMRTMAQWEDK